MLNKSSIVSAVIVNYNGKDYLGPCLQSIESQSYQPLEVIVIDNASTDDSVWMVERLFPRVTLLKNENNLYYSVAYNQGINASKGELILCLNNDIVLDKDFINFLVENKDFDSRIGMWAGKILRMDKETIDTTGQFLGRSRKPIDRGYGEKNNGQFDKKEYVFGVVGAAILLRREMLAQIKVNGEYFDEDFKLFYEDLDLCWRANRFGWKAYYVPQALAYHKRGGTIKTVVPKFKLLKKFNISYLSVELLTHLVKNRYLTIIKNDNLWDFIKNFVFIMSYDAILYSYILFFKPKVILQLFKHRNNFKKSLQKRKNIFERLNQLKIKYDLPRRSHSVKDAGFSRDEQDSHILF